MTTTTWGMTLGTICLIIIFICCSCCCCKCCRNCFFWLWEKWTPRDCWRQTQEKCCVNIHNYGGSRVTYTKAGKSSPAISLRSLPDLGNVITVQPSQAQTAEFILDEVMESTPIRTRSKMFR
jgi:hypothetical protein